MIEVFKLIKGIDKLDKNIFFSQAENNKVRGHQYKLRKSHSRLDIRKHYFSNRIVNTWNNLDGNVVEAETVNSFKVRIDKFIAENNRWEEE